MAFNAEVFPTPGPPMTTTGICACKAIDRGVKTLFTGMAPIF